MGRFLGAWGVGCALGLFILVRFIPLSACFSLYVRDLERMSNIEAFHISCCCRCHCLNVITDMKCITKC